MPRAKIRVKTKTSPALIDLHFHGAFGVDLMNPRDPAFESWNFLSRCLAGSGIAGFCATTLSEPWEVLLPAVKRLGEWIQSGQAPGALPLGIHLEGPYISPEACGAHPPHALRKLNFVELEQLWEASRHTLKILTIAPETAGSPEVLKKLGKWANSRKIHLSLGHSRATEEQARLAFQSGFRGVTHAWNALAFHQRSPGALGAALGRDDVSVELILDQVHVAPTVLRWTQALHERCCFVSDCVPAAATATGTWHEFGSLNVEFRDGACRVRDGHLAGGGILLPEAYADWLSMESRTTRIAAETLWKTTIARATRYPLEALRLPASLQRRLSAPVLEWRFPSVHRAEFRMKPSQTLTKR